MEVAYGFSTGTKLVTLNDLERHNDRMCTICVVAELLVQGCQLFENLLDCTEFIGAFLKIDTGLSGQYTVQKKVK